MNDNQDLYMDEATKIKTSILHMGDRTRNKFIVLRRLFTKHDDLSFGVVDDVLKATDVNIVPSGPAPGYFWAKLPPNRTQHQNLWSSIET